jgi:threonine dehydrogenase-like Zn-dependent dehydrogenase
MWAYRLVAPGVLARTEAPTPEPGPDQVLLRTLAGGICGSDLPKFRGSKGMRLGKDGTLTPGRPGYPLHEVVGEVVVGPSPGERVVGWATESDALAEYVATSAAQLHRYDTSLAAETAVVLQPLACVLYALRQSPVRDAHVTVLGLGPMGLLFCHALRSAGAAHVTGVDPVDRSDVADHFGLDEVVVAPSGVWAQGDGRPPDVVIEAVGHQTSTLRHAIDGVAVGGRIVYFGIPDDDHYPLDMERLMRKNLTLVGGVTRDRQAMLAAADRYLGTQPRLGADLVTSVFRVTDCQRAFDLAATTGPARRKVVLTLS